MLSERSHNDAESRELQQVFAAMDVDCDGRVSQHEFRAYLRKNPKGWPLADILDGQPESVKDQIVRFWFRKLDLTQEGHFDLSELMAFFQAMKQTKYKEMIYADFLLNLFDTNFDGRIDPEEYATMLRVLLGREVVPEYVRRALGAEGMDREDLVRLLHAVHCDFSKLDGRAEVRSLMGVVGILLAGIAVGVGIAAVASTFGIRRQRRA
jgi:Ca2+-binding EF-hand superfamily protein